MVDERSPTDEPGVPREVRLRFGRAAVQIVADRAGVEILHIKGDAVDPSLRPPRFGSDVDILVRPSQVEILDGAITEDGWSLYSSFDYGSPFGHAQTYVHEAWGHLDLHRTFPGIRRDPESAFDVLSRDSFAITVTGVRCAVPGVGAQAALLILNAARSGTRGGIDVNWVWDRATPEQRANVRAVAHELGADVAFAAAVGGLDHYRHEREYALWKVITEGGSRSGEWAARVRAAPSLREALSVLSRAPRVNVEHLAHELGREPTRGEVVSASVRRPLTAIADVWAKSQGGQK